MSAHPPTLDTMASLPMPQYLLHDWDPNSGVTMEAWARDLADKGWVTWAGPGCWTSIDGRRVWRVSLRREPELFKAELAAARRAQGYGTRTRAAYPQVTTPS